MPNPDDHATASASGAFRRAAIIGVGLIGGSIAHALRLTGHYHTVRGFDTNPAHAATALERGLVDEIALGPATCRSVADAGPTHDHDAAGGNR